MLRDKETKVFQAIDISGCVKKEEKLEKYKELRLELTIPCPDGMYEMLKAKGPGWIATFNCPKT